MTEECLSSVKTFALSDSFIGDGFVISQKLRFSFVILKYSTENIPLKSRHFALGTGAHPSRYRYVSSECKQTYSHLPQDSSTAGIMRKVFAPANRGYD